MTRQEYLSILVGLLTIWIIFVTGFLLGLWQGKTMKIAEQQTIIPLADVVSFCQGNVVEDTVKIKPLSDGR